MRTGFIPVRGGCPESFGPGRAADCGIVKGYIGAEEWGGLRVSELRVEELNVSALQAGGELRG